MTDSQPIAHAIELAERILSEVTRPEQDWASVRGLATSLARLAQAASQSGPGPPPDAGGSRGGPPGSGHE